MSSGHIRWSHSSLKDFETCARKYHEIRVLKKWPKEEGIEALFGTEMHDAAERYLRDGDELEPRFTFLKEALDALKARSGTKYYEHEMALTWELQPCAMDDENVWVRGIADLLIIDEANYTAWVLDYKTGNHKYADTDQLKLMSLFVFAHFPKIKVVRGALLFVLGGHIVKTKINRDERHGFWWDYRQRVALIEQATEADNWNPKKSGLCKKHCEVRSCEHNGKH